MADETDELLRQILATQKELLAEFQKDAERTTDFRIDALEQGKANQRKLTVFTVLMGLVIAAGLFFAIVVPRMASPNFPF